MINDLEELLKSAVSEVFTTMLDLTIQPETPNTPANNGAPMIAGAVGFIGKLTGVIYIYTPVSFARRITSQMLGVQDNEIESEEMVNDTMGELANMIVGHIKSRLSDRGNSCAMTIPSIVRGTNFCIEPVSSTLRRVNSYRCHDSQILLEVMIKQPDSAQIAQ